MIVLFDLENVLDMKKLDVLRKGKSKSKSKCLQKVIRARALKTKDRIMRKHNRKRQSGTGWRNMTCLIGLVKPSICHACNTCLK